MEENLTNEQKVFLLNDVKNRLEQQMYTYCVCLGIDYGSFDPASFVLEKPVMQHESTMLKNAGDSYIKVLAEISSLG